MSRHCIKPIVAGLAASVALLAGAAGGSASTSGHAVSPGSGTFTDPTGDASGPAPDITGVAVTDDPASGTITVTVTAAGWASANADSYPMVKVYLNTDNNVSTGGPDQLGADYYLAVDREPSGGYWWVMRWEGSGYVEVSYTPTMSFSSSGDWMTWTVNKNDLGGSKGFQFFAWSSSWDASNNKTGEDTAPDMGTWAFGLSAPPMTVNVFLTPKIGAPVTAPASPRAGSRVTVSFAVTRSDDQKPLENATMICDPKLAGKMLPHSESYKSGVGRLSFVVPKSAKGKRVVVKLTIKAPSYKGEDGTYVDATSGLTGTMTTLYSGMSATKVASFLVR